MSEDLVKRLRKRAIYDREIQAHNEVVAAALRGQRLLYDQDVRSASNTYAVRLCLDYERYAKNDAAIAADWDSAADAIETLTDALDNLLATITAEDQFHDRSLTITGPTANLRWLLEAEEDARAALTGKADT